MFNYNLLNPVNITYRNPKQNPAYVDSDGESSNTQKQAQKPVTMDENREGRHFPNGNKVQIDYTKNKVNISQVIEDFKSTIAAINAPEDISREVHSYLNLVEMESKKENPSREIILANLKNASKISDKFIEDSLKKPSTVVQDWVNALFLQNVELKADPSYINEAFRVQIPENKRKTGIQTDAAATFTDGTPANTMHNVSSNQQTTYTPAPNGYNKSISNIQTPSNTLNTISSTNDFQNSPVNIYDIPKNRITLNEIKPIGQINPEFFIQNEVQDSSTAAENIDAAPFGKTTPSVKTNIKPDSGIQNLTYSTTAPLKDANTSLGAPVSLGNNAYKTASSASLHASNTAQNIDNIPFSGASNNTISVAKNSMLPENSYLAGISNIQQDKNTYQQQNLAKQQAELPILERLSKKERAAKSNFVKAKRIIKGSGNPENALKLYNEALSLMENSTDNNLRAAIHFERGKLFDDFDYAEFALKDYNSATKCTDNNLKTHAHLKMGRIYDDYVMFDPAVEQYSLAVETSEEAKNPNGKTKALTYLAALFADRYDKENTETFNALSVDAAYETGNMKTVAKTLMGAGENFEYINEDIKALSAYKEAAKAAHSIKDYNLLSKSYEAASGTMDRLGNGAKAMTLLSKALLYRQKSELQED